MTMDYASIIKEIGRGAKGAKSIKRATAQSLFGALLDGDVPDMEVGAILLSLRLKGEGLEELLGFQAALGERTPQIPIPDGPRCVILPTYNGARKQPNLMPLVALLLAQQGIPVLIQGRHDFESRTNPFDLLTALGINLAQSLSAAGADLSSGRPVCLRVDMLAPGLDRLLSLRQRLGVRNSGHTLAKLLDPCRGRSVRVVAVTHPAYLETLESFLIAEKATAMLMRGTEGEAYASPRRRPRLLGFSDGVARELFAAAEFSDDIWSGESCSVEKNASLIMRIVAGELAAPQPIQDQAAALAVLAKA